MRIDRLIIFLLFTIISLSSCNPFDSNRVANYESELTEIIELMKDYDNVILDADEDDRFASDMRSMGIDYVIKNQSINKDFSGFIEEKDSLVIFIKKSQNLFHDERRIIFDYASLPRNFGNETISNASYQIIQLSPRWYYSTTGFD